MEISEKLKEFGLNNKETDVYLACLELGESSVNEIAIKSNIKRTTIYDILESLIKKGLISQTQRGSKRKFFAEEPEKIKKIIERKGIVII